MTIRSVIAYLLCAASMSTMVGFAAENIRIVAAPGQQAPGFPTGVMFGQLGRATINGSGEIAFVAGLQGPGISLNTNASSVWTGTPGNLQLLAQEGEPAPGTEDGTVFSTFSNYGGGGLANMNSSLPIAPNGEVAFFATLRGPSVVANVNDHGIWAGTPGNLQLVARRGDPTPGTGDVFKTIISTRFAYNDGGVAFYALLGASGNMDSIWAGRPGNLQLVLREGDVAPDLPGAIIPVNGINGTGPYVHLNINAQGKVAFFTRTQLPSSTSRDTYYAGVPGALNVIMLQGESAEPAVPGATFGSSSPSANIWPQVLSPTINNVGQISFFNAMAFPDSRHSFWIGTGSSLTLAALQGDPMPAPLAPGILLNALHIGTGGHVLNATGRLAVRARIEGPGITSSNDNVLLTGTPRNWTLLARDGDPAPGTEPGVVYANQGFDNPFINSVGEVAFSAELNTTTTSNNWGIWIMKPGVPPRLVARRIDSFDAGGGNIVGIAALNRDLIDFGPWSSGNQDGRPTVLSDNGQLVFWADLANDTTSTQAILIADPLDTDNDGVRDNLDTCIDVVNPDQLDIDGDGYGNACDPDLNQNGVIDSTDLSNIKAALRTSAPDKDLNGNGVVDSTDYSIAKSYLRQPPGPSCCGIPLP